MVDVLYSAVLSIASQSACENCASLIVGVYTRLGLVLGSRG